MVFLVTKDLTGVAHVMCNRAASRDKQKIRVNLVDKQRNLFKIFYSVASFFFNVLS